MSPSNAQSSKSSKSPNIWLSDWTINWACFKSHISTLSRTSWTGLLKDDAFSRSRSVLAAKRKCLVKEGCGNKPNASHELTDEEKAKLFETGEFGNHNPQRTLWWFLSKQFGFRARDESRKLCWGDSARRGRRDRPWGASVDSRKGKQNAPRSRRRSSTSIVLKRLPPTQTDALYFITSCLRPAVRRKLTAQNCHSIWQLINKPGAKAKFGTRAHHSARTKLGNLCPRRQKMLVCSSKQEDIQSFRP